MEYFLERRCTKIIINNKDQPRTTTIERTFSPCWYPPWFFSLLLACVPCSSSFAAKGLLTSWLQKIMRLHMHRLPRWMVHLNVSSVCCERRRRGHWIRVTKKKIIIIYNCFSYSLPTPFRCDGTKLDSVLYTNGRVPLLNCCWSNEGSRDTAAVMVDDGGTAGVQ